MEKVGWTGPAVDPNSAFEKALASTDPIPADSRLCLYVCKRMTDASFSDAVSIVGAMGGDVNACFAGAMMGMIDSNTVSYTRAEVAIVYDSLMDSIKRNIKSRYSTEDDIFISWHVDYAPNRDLADPLHEAGKIIKDAREASNGPKTPSSWGVGMKCNYTVRDGCAMFEQHVIDFKGIKCKINPWVKFYESRDIDDGRMAELLQPKRPYDVNIKFINRDIAENMNYTFEKNVLDMCKTKNWGIVSYLIETVVNNIPPTIGFDVLGLSASAYGSGEIQWDIINQLFAAGLPILDLSGKYLRTNTPLFSIIQYGEGYILEKFLQNITVPKVPRNGDLLDEIERGLVYGLIYRYQDKKYERYENQIFEHVVRMWISMHKQNDVKLKKKDKVQFALELYKKIIEYSNDSSFRSPKFMEFVNMAIAHIESPSKKSKKSKY